ncbi:MAG: helix-turn-helix domain-containing protein [Chloroflexi bacterium]|nr:helix-turn-helix domain-containing protein [Chloroflexota bacterium]
MNTQLSKPTQEGASIRELARRFGVSAPVLYELARQDRLPGCRRIGEKRFVVHVPSFQQWLESGGRAE